MKSSLRLLYQSQIDEQGYRSDPIQLQALDALQQRLDKLSCQKPAKHKGFLQKLLASTNNTKSDSAPRGLYIHGPVGRGKTFLMDLFYQALPGNIAMRLHFHHFMARIHRQLQELSGEKNPLRLIARQLRQECQVLCFDEFYITDIGDAMLLAGLLEALFENGLVLVATSNTQIDQLYAGGLQRQNFLPAIALLNRHCESLSLSGPEDYRQQHIPVDQHYFLPDELSFAHLFEQLTSTENPGASSITVLGRDISVRGQSNNIAWFDYEAICLGPRSQLDYIELAQRFSTILISNIPQFGGQAKTWIKARGTEDGSHGITSTGERKLLYAAEDDGVRRFIALIDELYESGTLLYLSAEVPLVRLYPGGALEFEFRRTLSRLTQM